MHTYIKSRNEPLWTVGFRANDGTWYPLEDHNSQNDAEKHVNFLNGGNSVVDVYMLPQVGP